MIKQKQVLYFHIGRMSFVRKDLDILKQDFLVREFFFRTKVKWKIPFSFLQQFRYLMIRGWSADYLMCFFAGYHSFLPVLFGRLTGKKTVIFLGGADCFRYPEFNYGHLSKPSLAWFNCTSARWAHLLLPVDESLMYAESDYFKPAMKQGIRYFCKNLKTPHFSIPLEYDTKMFRNLTEHKPPTSFITVGFNFAGSAYVRKGVDILIEAAEKLPGCSFTVQGISADKVKVAYPANVTFTSPVPYEDLPSLYSAHRFCLQLSIAEGFPSAICEAMLCECVPIGSNVAAIPEIVGDCGFLLQHRNVDELVALIKSAVERNDLAELGVRSRERICTKYNMGKRRKQIIDQLEKL